MVGLVRRVHGLRGVLRVEVLTDHPELRFAPGASLYPEGGRLALTVDEASPVADGPGWWVRFRERPDRNAAEPLVGTYLEALVPAAGADDAGTVWWHEVVGVEVVDLEGRVLGTVRDIYRAGGAEVYAVDGGPAGSFDVPAVGVFVREFRPREGRIVIDSEALGLDEDRAGRPTRPRGRRTTRAARAGSTNRARPSDGPPPAPERRTRSEGA